MAAQIKSMEQEFGQLGEAWGIAQSVSESPDSETAKVQLKVRYSCLPSCVLPWSHEVPAWYRTWAPCL